MEEPTEESESMRSLHASVTDPYDPLISHRERKKNERQREERQGDPAPPAVMAMWISLSSSSEDPPLDDECSWPTVQCKDEVVTEINMSRQTGWNGRIPTHIGRLTSLTHLDLSENNLQGSIPEQLYQLTELEHLHLHNNQLTGTLSDSIGNLDKLINLFLGSNNIYGFLPHNIMDIKKLRFLSLGKNNFVGTFPTKLRFRELFYLDLSYNNFSGRLHGKAFNRFSRIRHIYLDHNQFEGEIPEGLMLAGGGRIKSIYLNDNKLTGEIPHPTNWIKGNTQLNTLNVQNNKMKKKIPDEICSRFVFKSGDLVQLNADCDICKCPGLCKTCFK